MGQVEIRPTLTWTDEEIKLRFSKLQNKAQVADLLEIPLGRLLWHLHKRPSDSQYATIELPKKAGGMRKIEIPVTALKIIQSKLNHILQIVYKDYKKSGVHGFLRESSIVSNASMHKGKYSLLNLDLEDFFPSITFGRVRGVFMSPPYRLNAEVATVIAQIACHNRRLPQGAPTSPIISNIVCARLDVELKKLAAKNQCTYTRYADDITFSTKRRRFHHSIVTKKLEGTFLGEDLLRIIRSNGFKVKESKVRHSANLESKEVTGIRVNNNKLNVSKSFYKELRTTLYQWKKFGYASASQTFNNRDAKYRPFAEAAPKLQDVVRGKLEFFAMVRGRNDALYLKYRHLFLELCQRGFE